MRFKKGDKIEVLNKREDHAQSWWRAEIISIFGLKYCVRYDRDFPGVGYSAERVSRKVIRPCPPTATGRLDWVPGDIVEVLNNFSWKLARIVMFAGQEYFFVRLLGSPLELTVHSSDIRLRQCWQDNKWITLQKESAKYTDRTTNMLSKEPFFSRVPQILDNHFQAGTMNTSPAFMTGVKKSSRICSRTHERSPGGFRKMRAVNKRSLQGVSAFKSSGWNKVDAVASPQILFGEKYMHSSVTNWKTGMYEVDQWVGISNDDSGHCNRIMLESSGAESVSSSVGSCSVIDSPCRSIVHPFFDIGQNMRCSHEHPEASTTSGRETYFPENEAVTQDIHNLELHAYRCTMTALYVSGPISWEQEALLTNLRLVLHISNNEHSMELKNLVSAQTDDFVR